VIGAFEQERKLGTSNGAKVMGPYIQQVAGDDQGFITQLRALRDSLKEARRGIELAREAYLRTEEATRANLANRKS
jgi:ribosomal protein L19E